MVETDPGPSTGGAQEWLSPTRRFSPFVALCGVGFLGRLSYEMARLGFLVGYAVGGSAVRWAGALAIGGAVVAVIGLQLHIV